MFGESERVDEVIDDDEMGFPVAVNGGCCSGVMKTM